MDKGSLSRGGGNFVLSEVELILEHNGVMEPIEWLDAEADYAQKGFEPSKAIDENPETGWAVDGHEKHEPRSLCLTLKSPLEVQAGHRLTLRLKHETQHEGHMIGRFRLSSTPVNDPTLTETGIQDDLYRWLITEEEERDEAQNKKAITAGAAESEMRTARVTQQNMQADAAAAEAAKANEAKSKAQALEDEQKAMKRQAEESEANKQGLAKAAAAGVDYH